MISYSVIIPHYNSPVLLKRCIASIPEREDIQVIIVDDCSDPKKVDFAHLPGRNRPYTEIYRTPYGGSAGRARNIGLSHAKGQWLVFADADDFFTSEAWDVMDTYLNSPYDIIYFRHTSVDSDTLEPNDRHMVYGRYFDAYFDHPTDNTLDHLRYRHDIPWGKMIRRSMVEENRITFGETRYCNDTLFSTKTAISARTVFADKRSTYCVTTEHNSLIHQQSKEAILTRLDVLLTKNQLLRQHGLVKHQPSVLFYFKDALFQYGIASFIKAVCLAYRHRTPLSMIYIYSRLYKN